MLARRGGFTLIELLVVLAVLSVLAGVALPRLDFAFSPRAQVERAAKRIVRISRYSRDMAICLCENHTLHFQLETGKYWVSIRDPNGLSREVKDGLMLAGRWPEGVVLEDVYWVGQDGQPVKTMDITFYTTGECDPGDILLGSDQFDGLMKLSWHEGYLDTGPCEWKWIELGDKTGY